MITFSFPTRRGRRQSGDLTTSAAAAADLAAVVLGAGGTVPDVVEVLASFGPMTIQPTFAAVVARVTAGELLAESLTIELSPLGSAFHPLTGALIMADGGGASVGSILQHLADDARQARRMDSERRAKKLSVQLLIPLVVTLLPAVVIGAVVPIVIVALTNLEVTP